MLHCRCGMLVNFFLMCTPVYKWNPSLALSGYIVRVSRQGLSVRALLCGRNKCHPPLFQAVKLPVIRVVTVMVSRDKVGVISHHHNPRNTVETRMTVDFRDTPFIVPNEHQVIFSWAVKRAECENFLLVVKSWNTTSYHTWINTLPSILFVTVHF